MGQTLSLDNPEELEYFRRSVLYHFGDAQRVESFLMKDVDDRDSPLSRVFTMRVSGDLIGKPPVAGGYMVSVKVDDLSAYIAAAVSAHAQGGAVPADVGPEDVVVQMPGGAAARGVPPDYEDDGPPAYVAQSRARRKGNNASKRKSNPQYRQVRVRNRNGVMQTVYRRKR